MTGISAHDRLAAAALSKGRATSQLLEIRLCDTDPARRRIASIALAFRHPIYTPKSGRF